MGKWSHLEGTKIKDLPINPERKAAFYAAVDLVKDLPSAEVAKLLDAAKDRKDAIEADLKTVNGEIETYDYALRQAMKRDGLESMVANGYRYTPSPEPYAQVTDKTEFLAWALQHMTDNLNLPWQTLQATIKSALEEGGEFPPGVDVYLKKTVSRRKQA